MKEVRYNDRIWFGKHKGARICDIIKADPNFIQKLLLDQKIKLDKKSKTFFDERSGRKSPSSRYWINTEERNVEFRQETQGIPERRVVIMGTPGELQNPVVEPDRNPTAELLQEDTEIVECIRNFENEDILRTSVETMAGTLLGG